MAYTRELVAYMTGGKLAVIYGDEPTDFNKLTEYRSHRSVNPRADTRQTDNFPAAKQAEHQKQSGRRTLSAANLR